MKYLDQIRKPTSINSRKKQLLISLSILLLGIILGAFSKYLDYRQAELPQLLSLINDVLDLGNFLSIFSPWITIAVCIAIYAQSQYRASLNVFLFFAGMVTSYYLYSNFIAGFFPKSYAIIWIAFTILSPFMAFLCWYAKGEGWIAYILSAGIIGISFDTAFAYGFFYIHISSFLQLLMFLISIILLRRSWKETGLLLAAGIVIGIILDIILPFSI